MPRGSKRQLLCIESYSSGAEALLHDPDTGDETGLDVPRAILDEAVKTFDLHGMATVARVGLAPARAGSRKTPPTPSAEALARALFSSPAFFDAYGCDPLVPGGIVALTLSRWSSTKLSFDIDASQIPVGDDCAETAERLAGEWAAAHDSWLSGVFEIELSLPVPERPSAHERLEAFGLLLA